MTRMPLRLQARTYLRSLIIQGALDDERMQGLGYIS